MAPQLVRLAPGAVTIGGSTVSLWAASVPVVAFVVGGFLLFATWVLSDKGRTAHLVKVIEAVRGTRESAKALGETAHRGR